MQLYPMFFYNKRAWEELYTIIFRLFDQKWKQMGLGYMGFQQVIDATEEGVSELIKKKSVMGVPAIFDMLGILLEDLDSFRNAPDAPPIRRSVTMMELARSPRATVDEEASLVVDSPDVPLRKRDESQFKTRSSKRCYSATTDGQSTRKASKEAKALFLSPRLS